MDLVVEIYRLCALLPKEEIYGLSSQMKRATVSIPSNIAEGFRRRHDAEKMQFNRIAYGSGAELETQIDICTRLDFFNKKQSNTASKVLDEVMRMLNAMVSK